MHFLFLPFSLVLAASLSFTSCKHNAGNDVEPGGSGTNTKIVFTNHSTTPAFVKTAQGFEGVDVFTLISSVCKNTTCLISSLLKFNF